MENTDWPDHLQNVEIRYTYMVAYPTLHIDLETFNM